MIFFFSLKLSEATDRRMGLFGDQLDYLSQSAVSIKSHFDDLKRQSTGLKEDYVALSNQQSQFESGLDKTVSGFNQLNCDHAELDLKVALLVDGATRPKSGCSKLAAFCSSLALFYLIYFFCSLYALLAADSNFWF